MKKTVQVDMQSERIYRNVAVNGNHVTGEYTDKYSNFEHWTNFRGKLPLMRINAAADLPGVLRKIMKHADGYGLPGFFPGGYDWSGIRDSSDAAIESMDAVAKAAWGNRPWPWEK